MVDLDDFGLFDPAVEVVRDPDMFGEPLSFCLERDGATNHLAFGRGIHFCVGAALSRLEGKVVLDNESY